MRLRFTHDWDVETCQAIAIQERLRDHAVASDGLADPRLVAGIDVSFESGYSRAAVAVLRLPELELVDWGLSLTPTRFPYVPGLLSFREIPAALEALSALRRLPDAVLCDGHGLAHPRRFGLACHLGLLTDLPTVGVAKTRLVGEHRGVEDARGAWEPLWHRGEVVGAALRTRAHTRPVYVSVGHRVGLEAAIRLVMRCTGRFRLPETTRWAHRLASGQPAPRPAEHTAPRAVGDFSSHSPEAGQKIGA
jgi:deoxyribonuclease V